MAHHIENLLAIMNVYVQSEMYLCDFVCVWRRERVSAGGRRRGIYSPVFLCTWWYESQCVCVCVWMNVDETEKAALCIAVHHRQYPCFSSIHIHTPFSYPLQEQEKSANVFECTAKEDLSQKKNRKGNTGRKKSEGYKKKKRGKREQI